MIIPLARAAAASSHLADQCGVLYTRMQVGKIHGGPAATALGRLPTVIPVAHAQRAAAHRLFRCRCGRARIMRLLARWTVCARLVSLSVCPSALLCSPLHVQVQFGTIVSLTKAFAVPLYNFYKLAEETCQLSLSLIPIKLFFRSRQRK